ncbi:helix-turn-helix transcriptional regulator [Actinomadura sp. BRA 177]|uniref:helix-turn-helix domain-containing protein n=1 Tax=Actinomadura sp. BRA 177 TaxID=2745202 RepID=UPI0015953F7A|nr:helix-turn-helix transcriptional regulator [Actinomadura sp. BRA 177]NVI87522.1 helix-turn-helix transcriptional regulator [Actinomadura sp. BRA 177]
MPKVRDPLDPKISQWHLLSYYLRFFREKEGLSLTQWGKIIGAARSTVSNMEAGRHRIHEDHAKLIDRHFGTGRLFELLLWFARTAHNPDWFRQYTEYEKQATFTKIYHGGLIPLLFQTDDYTKAFVQVSDSQDLEAELTARLGRKQAMLGRTEPAFTWLLLGEAALASQVGGPAVMEAQLRQLRAMTDLPHTSVRVVPFTAGAHRGVDGYFQVIGLENRDIGYAGAQKGGRLIEGPSEARELSFIFDRIGAKAASEDDSRSLIERYLETYP